MDGEKEEKGGGRKVKQLKKKRMLAMTLATAMTAQTFGAGSLPVMAETVGSSQDSYGTNMDFEAGTEGWTTGREASVSGWEKTLKYPCWWGIFPRGVTL